MVTVFAPDKTVRQREAAFATLTGAWAALSNVAVRGYEIFEKREDDCRKVVLTP